MADLDFSHHLYFCHKQQLSKTFSTQTCHWIINLSAKMISLKELREITFDLDKKRETIKKGQSAEQKAKEEGIFKAATHNLGERLKKAALEKKKKYIVFQVGHSGNQVYGNHDTLDNNFMMSEVRNKTSGSNLYYQIHVTKSITYEMMERWMIGAAKRIFDFCKESGLEPKLNYWTDGGGMDEGIQIVIDWSKK